MARVRAAKTSGRRPARSAAVTIGVSSLADRVELGKFVRDRIHQTVGVAVRAMPDAQPVRDADGLEQRSYEVRHIRGKLVVSADDGDDALRNVPVRADPAAELGVIDAAHVTLGRDELLGSRPREVIDRLDELRCLIEQDEPSDVVEQTGEICVFGRDAIDVYVLDDGSARGRDLDRMEPELRLARTPRNEHPRDRDGRDEFRDMVRAESGNGSLDRLDRRSRRRNGRVRGADHAQCEAGIFARDTEHFFEELIRFGREAHQSHDNARKHREFLYREFADRSGEATAIHTSATRFEVGRARHRYCGAWARERQKAATTTGS